MRTNVPHIFVIGDIVGEPMQTQSRQVHGLAATAKVTAAGW
jgi:pyruvate/2-oxoglutarate dehydrogenase complex dihydrolipoamide dehydrogenase (E3) component